MFTVNLTRDSSPEKSAFGWRLDCVAPNGLHIFEVRSDVETPIAKYNESVSPAKQIRNGDYIKAVNGLTGAKEMAEVVDKEMHLQVLLCRPHLQNVHVDKQGGPLGLELMYWHAGTSVLVGEINDGAVKKQGMDLQKGDRIVSVNGISGRSEVLLDKIRSSQTLDLAISRCP